LVVLLIGKVEVLFLVSVDHRIDVCIEDWARTLHHQFALESAVGSRIFVYRYVECAVYALYLAVFLRCPLA
jgi:hypothetical protein